MTRLVELDATGPRKLDADDLDPEKGDVAVCRCGLSASFPFCDGSHRATRDEGNDLYVYDEDGTRRVVEDVLTRAESGREGEASDPSECENADESA